MSKIISRKTKEGVLKDYLAGYSIGEICQKYKITNNTVYKYIGKNRRYKRRAKEEHKNKDLQNGTKEEPKKQINEVLKTIKQILENLEKLKDIDKNLEIKESLEEAKKKLENIEEDEELNGPKQIKRFLDSLKNNEVVNMLSKRERDFYIAYLSLTFQKPKYEDITTIRQILRYVSPKQAKAIMLQYLYDYPGWLELKTIETVAKRMNLKITKEPEKEKRERQKSQNEAQSNEIIKTLAERMSLETHLKGG